MFKIKYVIILIIVVIAAIIMGFRLWSSKEYDDILGRFETLQVGMTKENVTSIMGTPINSYKTEYYGKEFNVWSFNTATTASEFPTCYFDADNDLLYLIEWEDVNIHIIAEDSLWPPN
jgi:uncharacterized protein YxeA